MPTVRSVRRALASALTAGALAAPAAHAQFAFSTISVPGAIDTYAWGVNGAGQVVGSYTDAAGTHGFLSTGGAFTTLNVPGASTTTAYGINAAGQIVGGFTDQSGVSRGFVYTGGAFSVLNVPGATTAVARGINASGQIVGSYTDTLPNFQHGFIATGDVFTTINAVVFTYATGINDAGQAVGYYFTPNTGPNGYGYSAGVVTDFRLGAGTIGINNLGQVAGYSSFRAPGLGSGFHGVLRAADGGVTYFNVPGATDTYAQGINDAGVLVGWYEQAGVGRRGFVATPNAVTVPEPATLALVGAGLAGVGGVTRARRRRR